MKHKIQKMT